MTDYQKYDPDTHPEVKLIDDWNNLLDMFSIYPAHFPQVNDWIGGYFGTLSIEKGIVGDQIIFMPCPIVKSVKISGIATDVATVESPPVAGHKGRLGIYTNKDGKPDSLYYDAMTDMDYDTTGPKVHTISPAITLNRGLWWLAFALYTNPIDWNADLGFYHSCASYPIKVVEGGGCHKSWAQGWTYQSPPSGLPATAQIMTAYTRHYHICVKINSFV